MAHMDCSCGASMSNVMCPSENIIYVMAKQRVEKALSYNAAIKLSDFITNWDELTDSRKLFISEDYDFWFCTQCRRIHQCDIHIGGKPITVYKPVENNTHVIFDELCKMDELIVFTNTEEDNATEKDPSIALASFIASLPKIRYFLSTDQKIVYVFDCKKNQVVLTYQSEELM